MYCRGWRAERKNEVEVGRWETVKVMEEGMTRLSQVLALKIFNPGFVRWVMGVWVCFYVGH
jgi:hypothetical protein